MTHHCGKLGDTDLLLYLADPEDDSLSALRTHLATCAECAGELRAWQSLQGELAANLESDDDEHPSAERLAVFADQPDSLGVAMRTEIQAHLSVCAACRDEIRVLGAVRIERAAAAEVVDQAAAESRDELRARVAQRSVAALPRRRSTAMLLLALALSGALVLAGRMALERGVVPWSPSEWNIGEIASPQSASTAAYSAEDERAGNQSVESPAALGDAFARPQVPPPAVAARPRFSAPPLQSSEASAADGVAPADSDGAVDERRPGRDRAQDLPSASSTGEILRPQQLLASLAEQTAAKSQQEERDGGGAASAEAAPSEPAGAAVVEIAPSAAEDAVDGSDAERVETAEIPADSMIVGVRQLGAVPTRTMLGSVEEGDAGRAGTPEQGDAVPQDGAVSSYASTLPARVLFAGGSSYVFTAGEVANGIDLQFALPLVETRAHGAEMRIRELGTDRELEESFAVPEEAVQDSPLETLRVPAGWLRPGRFTVQLDAPTVDGFEPESLHLRIVESD